MQKKEDISKPVGPKQQCNERTLEAHEGGGLLDYPNRELYATILQQLLRMETFLRD